MSNLEIKVKVPCEKCNSKGFIVRPPGPIQNQNLYEAIKNNQMTPEQIQELVATPPVHIKGMTDVESQFVCGYCNGSGSIEKQLTLDELKNLVNS